jgi:hypothetical protein
VLLVVGVVVGDVGVVGVVVGGGVNLPTVIVTVLPLF